MISSDLPVNHLSATSNGFEIAGTNSVNMNMPDTCPNCGKSLLPSHLMSLDIIACDNPYIASIYLCNSCNQFFFTISYTTGHTFKTGHVALIYPILKESVKISSSIEAISPNFVKIYNQAINAENNKLDEICGMGYRKALEFLIKDFAIYKYPENTEDIIKCTLSNCITKYCTNDRIKTLATACAWIGNDECRYIRKHEDYSVESLKAFINATVTFIESELSFDAATQLLQS